MKNKTFLPLLAPNKEIDISSLTYPVLGSVKLDGCRLLVKQGKLVTRSLKNLPNKQYNEKFDPLRQYSRDNNYIIDGEIYAHGVPFQFIVSCFMTQDFEAKDSIKKWKELCEEHDYYISREEVYDRSRFYCFDIVENENFNRSFKLRYLDTAKLWFKFSKLLTRVHHKLLNNKEEVEEYFQEALKDGYEGLILRNPEGIYKFDRATIKQNIIFKYKPFVTTDRMIKGFIQATEVNKNVEKTINEKGYSRTSKKQGDRHLINKASGFVVDFNGNDLTIPIAMTDKQKKYIWTHQEEYIGKCVEFKYMEIGMKKDGLPRIPKFVRMRPDKDE